jgi:hypothetical protein
MQVTDLSLDNFEQHLPAALLQAGEKLWQREAIEFSQLSADQWLGSLKQGRKLLQCNVTFEGRNLAAFDCNCDVSPAPCAHLAAVMLHFSLGAPDETLSLPKKSRTAASKAIDPVLQLLQEASREQLEALLLELSKKDAAVKSLLQLKLSAGVVRSAQYYVELEEAVTAKLRTTKTAKPFKNMADDWKKRVSILQKQKDAGAAESIWELTKAIQKLMQQHVAKDYYKLYPFLRVLKLAYAVLPKRAEFDQQLLQSERDAFLLAMLDDYPIKYVIHDDLQQLLELALEEESFVRAIYSRFSERYTRLNDRTWSRLLARLIALEPQKADFYVAKYIQCCFERNWSFARQLGALTSPVREQALGTYFNLLESTRHELVRRPDYREMKEKLLN